mmetsp:Transcript_4024/g.5790  ORF Transcript_4024/g.5790 Transcript_4024/m.5790 type:complete len:517 (-) Transcript_4024:146-1696(-)|eukprot:CAMPEP_0194230440 /NCGR_PEP_ID=MMETSP0156-20130528/44413_1 /TAXON_ID=33649 /ORGANISM="Thalassionema nitzschioides, Strain L26-B" /LENGTH=516 /DNA_ID=CAMNT_0038963027 /DNA_START=157 /DNA_END=1707 /DNA_ORIENTATION=+
MRVILSAYRNQNRTDSSTVIHTEDYFELQENLPSPSHTLSENRVPEGDLTSNECYKSEDFLESQQKVSTGTSTIFSSKVEDYRQQDSSEQKLPAARSEKDSRKRKTLSVESSELKRTCSSPPSNDSKKPAAKMTAGRCTDGSRESPPFVLENHAIVPEVAVEKDKLQDAFRRALKQEGLEIREQEGDGNCLFRAVSFQVYGDPNMHMEVRHQCLDHMVKDEEHFSLFVEGEEFDDYIKRKRKEGVHGNNPEIQAISELFNRPVEVFTPENGAKPLNIFQSEYKTSDVPIRLSFQDNHYDAVVDPLLPTAGLGLGLPGLQPGLADKMQLEEAVRESDQMADQAELEKVMEESHNDQLQRVIKESSLSIDQLYSKKVMDLSDLEATNLDLEQAVLESSMEEFRKSEAGRKKQATDQETNYSFPRNIMTGSIPSSAVLPAPSAASLPFASVATTAAASVPLPQSTESTAQNNSLSSDEYSSTVQELVMNGFELSRVLHAYELIGDNFDDLLAFLVSTNT